MLPAHRRCGFGEACESFGPCAVVLVIVCQIGALADDPNLDGGAQPTLADTRVKDRRFHPRIGTDDRDPVGLVDARDRRVEDVGRPPQRRIEFRPVLTAIHVDGAERRHERFQREHVLDGA